MTSELIKDMGLIFLTECPATPLTHILALNTGDYTESLVKSLGSGNPVDATLYLTRACNLRCATCYVSASKPLPNELNAGEWIRVVDELGKLGVRYLYLLGGEPLLLLNRGLLDIVKRGKENGMIVSLSTNGTLVSEEAAVKLRDSGVDQVQVSLDGPNPVINDAIRGHGSFSKAINAIKYLKDAGVTVSLSYTVTISNADYVKDFVKLASDLKIPVVTFIRVQEFGRASGGGLGISNELAHEVLIKLSELSDVNVKVVYSGFRFGLLNLMSKAYRETEGLLNGLKVVNYGTCPAGRSRLVIDSNGDIYGCELLMRPEFREGNVRRDELSKVWVSGFKAFRNRVPSPLCLTCPFFKICRGGCPARVYAKYGSLNGPDPQCTLMNS
ncbi:radical SAM/SPASM domain-containing protein [Caldivirga maquilingensis]|uniref:Radical SAM domain protein n=1 Tax=Caldivirga maquilingensis (strain ATCC 700844 / DSM 13496 / JCM 10307 / IC-167) TaxID=397948 RepID=A8MCE4_CALMQ|nr:radical SAM protein [Caldivirga maquilingensis]ABW01450.1 Radical SAM domain protein [Caldivirga maquilingensis IC-167]